MNTAQAIKIVMDAANIATMRELVKANPEKYDPETQERLFTAEELRDLSQSMRGAA